MNRLILVVAAVLFAAPSFAGEGAIAVTPAVVELSGTFGQSTTQTLSITNGTTQELTFEMIAHDVVIANGKRNFAPAGAIAGSIAATAVFSTPSVTVPARASRSVTATVTVPSATAQRAVAIIFRGTTRVIVNQTSAFASIGVLMTFRLSDGIAIDTAAPSFTPQTATQNLRLTTLCSNRGSEPAFVRGVAAVLDPSGALVGRFNLQPRRFLPGEKGELVGEYPSELPSGRYRVLLTLDPQSTTTLNPTDVVVE